MIFDFFGTKNIANETKELKQALTGEVEKELDLSKLGYFDGIFKGQDQLKKSIGGSFDSSKIDAYVKSLDGLNDAQKQAVIMSSGLNKSQKEEMLARVLNTTVTKDNTQKTQENIKADLNDVTSNEANIQSTKRDSKATQENTDKIRANTKAKKENNGVEATDVVVDTADVVVDTADNIVDTADNIVDAGKTGTSIIALLGSKLKTLWTVIKGIGSGILALVQAHPIIAGITVAVTALTAVFVGQKKAEEEHANAIKKAYEEATAAIKEIKDEMKDLDDSVDNIKDRYAELAQGVDQLTGKNSSLSTDDYNEFLDLSNKLAELFPTLTKGYDDNGNAILDLSGNVDTIVGSLNNLVDVQKQLANQEIIDKMPSIWSGYTVERTKYENELAYAQNIYDGAISALDFLEQGTEFTVSQSGNYWLTEALGTALENAGIINDAFYELAYYYDENSAYKTRTYDFSALSNTQFEQFKNALSDFGKEIKYAKGQIDSLNSGMNQYLHTWLSGEWLYIQGDSGIQQAMQEILFNTDWLEQAAKAGIDTTDWNKVSQWLRDEYLNGINNLSEEDKIKLSSLFTKDLSAFDKLQIAQELQDYFDANGIDIKLDFILDGNVDGSTKDVVDRFTAKNQVLSGNDTDTYNELQSFFEKQGIDTEAEYEQWLTLTQGINDATQAMEAWIQQKSQKALLKSFNNEQTEAIKQYEDVLSSITDVLSNPEAYNITELMQTFSDYDWSRFLSGFEDLDTALNNIGQQALQKVIESFEGFKGAEPVIEALNKLLDNTINKVGKLSDALSSIQSAHDLLQTIREDMQVGGITVSNLQQIINTFPELELAVAKYNSGLITSQELYEELEKQYRKEYEALKNANREKLLNNEIFYQEILNNEEDKVKKINEAYQIDLQNYKNLAQAKLKIQQELEKKLIAVESGWKAYYDIKQDENGNYYAESTGYAEFNDPRHGVVTTTHGEGSHTYYDESMYTEHYKEIQKQVFEYVNSLNQLQIDFDSLLPEFKDLDLGNLDFGEESSSVFDWIETLIDRIQRKIDNFGKTISATYKSWIDRNGAVKDSIAELNKELGVQEQAATEYWNKAKSVGLKKELAEKVREGDLSFYETSDDDTKEKIDQYREYYEKYLAAKDRELEIEADIVAKYQERFDLISSEYDAQLGVIEHKANMINGMIDQAEASGHMVSRKYYDNLIALETQIQADLLAKKGELEAALAEAMANGVTEGSETWYDLTGQILEVDEAIQESTNSVIEFNNQIRELEWTQFDKIQDLISEIHDEKDFFIELMSNEDLFDDNGNWTEYADATAGLHAMGYNTYLAQAEAYAKEIADLDTKFAGDTSNDYYIERRKELLEAQRENILAAEDEKQAMIDLAREGYDAMLESLDELIEKRKEALDSERDLYEYQKKIADQTKNIASIEKQLMAYEGDDSEETQAKVQQLKVSLEEAKDELEQSEYDRWRQDQEQMLDKFRDDAQDWVDQRLENQDELIRDILAAVDGDTNSIKNTLDGLANEVGISMSSSMTGIFGKGSVFEKVNTTLTSIESYVATLVGEADAKAGNNSNNVGGGSNAGGNNAGGNNQPSNSGSNTDDIQDSEDKKWGSWFTKKKYSYSKSQLEKNKDTSVIDRLAWLGYDNSFDARAKYYSAMGGSGTYTGSAKQNKWMIAEMKKHKGYATGSRRIKNNELAWTQENGQELIYRSKDGAMLTPLGTGDAVFTSEMTQRLWDIAKTPEIFSTLTSTALPKGFVSNGTNNSVQNDVVMNISLPNVVDVDGFVNELRTNKRFEKVVQSMTIGAISSKGNSYNKLKY